MSKALYSNKRLEKTIIARIILISCIIVIDIVLLPWLLKFPFFLREDIINAPNKWIAYGLINSYKAIFSDRLFRNLFLYMQLPVAALILAIAWNTEHLRKRNRIKDGIGGPDPSGAGQHGTSRWQNKHEMDHTCNVWLTEQPLKSAGTIFGMEKSRNGSEKVWYNKDDLHTLLIAATRSGKSRKIFLPTIWTLALAGESMVIGDPKGELYIASKERLEKEGYKVISLNFREPAKGNQWNMLYMAARAVKQGNIPKAVECAWDIATTIINRESASTTEPIWINGAQSVIASLIISTIMDSEFDFQKHMTTVYYLLSELAPELADGSIPLNDYIEQLPRRHPARDAFAAARIAAAKTRASFFASVLSELRLFTDPNIQDMTCKQDHEFEHIGIDKTAVFLIIPDERAARNVLATIYIDQLYQSLVDLANKSGGRIPRRVNFLLDEFGNLPAIPEFDKKLTVAGGRGMRFTLAVQDIAQLKKLYKNNQQTITGNCHIWIYLKTKDIETSKLISEMTGKYTVATENSSSTVQSKGHSSTFGEGLTGRPLLTDDEVRRWDIEESLVFPMSYFPARYPLPDLSFWRANAEYGFVTTGDIDKDKEINRKIVEERWNNIYTRAVQEVSIWLPEVVDTPVEKPITNKNPTHRNNSSTSKTVKDTSESAAVNLPGNTNYTKSYGEPLPLIKDTYVEVPTQVETSIEVHAEDDDVKAAQHVSLNDLDIQSILKSASTSKPVVKEDDEDFL